jgi:hypothetical protein
LHSPQRQSQGACGVFFSIAAEKATLDHVCQTRHLHREPAQSFIEQHETFVGIYAQALSNGQGHVRLSPPSLIRQSGGGVIDESMVHGQGCCPEKVRFVGEPAGLPQA